MPANVVDEVDSPAAYRRARSHRRPEKDAAVVVAAGSALGALAGAAGVILGIVALAGSVDLALGYAAIAAIVIGAGMTVHFVGAAPRGFDAMEGAGDIVERTGLVTGLLVGALAGATGVVLGILALAGIAPFALVATAAIVLGGGALLAAIGQRTLGRLALPPARMIDRVAYGATEVSAGVLALAGAGAVVLGILALIDITPIVALSATAMIVLGATLFVAGAALSLRYGSQLHAYPETIAPPIAALELSQHQRRELVDLLTARLAAGRTGGKLYSAIITKLRVRREPTAMVLVPTLEAFAAEERDNEQWLETQLHGLGANVHGTTELADLESRESSGIEQVVVHSSVEDPLHLLHALHAAELSDAAGWKLSAHLVSELGDRGMALDLDARLRAKERHIAVLERAIQREAERRTRLVIPEERVDATAPS